MFLKHSYIKQISNGIATIFQEKLEKIGETISKEVFKILSMELSQIRTQIVNLAYELIGTTGNFYLSPENGLKPGEFDCSGFITYLLSQFGLSQEGIRHSNEYFDSFGTYVQNPIPGDIIIFSNGVYPSHIGLYIGDNKYIHRSDRTLKVEITEIMEEKIDGNGPYISNPIGFKRITLKVEGFENTRWNKVL